MRHIQAKPFGNSYTSGKLLFVHENTATLIYIIPNFTVKHMLNQTLMVLLKKNIIRGNAQLFISHGSLKSTSIR